MSTSGVSPVPREARPYQGERAGVVTRMVAAVIDALTVAGILLVGYGVVAGVRFMLSPRHFSLPRAGWLFNLTAAFVVLVIYLTAAWVLNGRTYGCLVMGLRVVSRHKENPRLIGALARAIGCVLFPIGILWCAVSAQHRSLQDVLFRTSVIYDWGHA